MSREVPQYRHHSNGQAFVQHKSIPNASHRLYLGKYDSPESKSRYAKFIEGLKKNAPVVSRKSLSPLTVEEIAVTFLNHMKSIRGEKNKETVCYRDSVRHLLNGLEWGRNQPENCGDIGLDTIEDLAPRHLVMVQRSMASADYCRRHINQTVKRIKRVFKWAVFEGLAPKDLHAHLQTTPHLKRGQFGVRESKKIGKVKWESIEVTAKYSSPQIAAMMKIQYLCGMRPGEVCIMRPMDIDRSPGDVWIFRPEAHKTQHHDKTLLKAIGKEAQKILQPFLDRDPEAYLFSPREAEEWRLSQIRKRPQKKKRKPAKRMLQDRYNTNSYRRAIVYAIAKAQKNNEKLGHWFPLQSRHASATEVDAALGRKASQKWMGHALIETTATYIETDHHEEITELLQIARQLDGRKAS